MTIFNVNSQEKAQKRLADEIADNLLISSAIYDAFLQIPRKEFVPKGMERQAYSLDALPILGNQWISSPLTVAKMTSALEIEGVDNILEIGCGSGYQAAILSKIVRRVFTIERIESLLKEAKERFAKLDLQNIHVRFDDGQRGWKSYAPYERILFSAATELVPQKLFDQLANGGILVAPIKDGEKQIITKYIKKDGIIREEKLEDCLFVPILDGTDR